MDERTLFGAAGINRRTAYAYERLLTNLLVVEALPAWTSNRLKRLVLMPKRHLVEPALVGAVLGLDANLVLRSGDLIGRLLETFVVAQLRAELGLSAARPGLDDQEALLRAVACGASVAACDGDLTGLPTLLELEQLLGPAPDAVR